MKTLDRDLAQHIVFVIRNEEQGSSRVCEYRAKAGLFSSPGTPLGVLEHNHTVIKNLGDKVCALITPQLQSASRINEEIIESAKPESATIVAQSI